jgi:hypothetical protein
MMLAFGRCLGRLQDHAPAAKAILVKHLGADYVDHQMSGSAEEFSLRAMSIFDPDRVTPALVSAIDSDLRTLPH